MHYKSYDKIPEHDSLLLDLPFREGVGAVTMDHAKPHHQDVLLINTPTWATLASGLGVLTFDSTTDEYIELDNAASVDLNFIAGDYSYGAWVYWTIQEFTQMLIGRYFLNVSGWEIYFTQAGAINYLTQRHSHAGTLVPPVTGNPRSACYSVGWTPDMWHFVGVSRIGGGEGTHYRNGAPIRMVTGGLVDPETNNNDLTIGCRYTKDANFWNGKMYRPRVWNRVLSAAEWLTLFNRERDWFGV